jgi:alkylated DNA repair protein (DNA oxidative demethylase)
VLASRAGAGSGAAATGAGEVRRQPGSAASAATASASARFNRVNAFSMRAPRPFVSASSDPLGGQGKAELASACARGQFLPASGAEIVHARGMRPSATTAARESPEPAGFLYVPELITPAEERALLEWFMASPDWKQVTFRGQIARRRAMSFGARYLTQGRQIEPAPELPPELAVYRNRMVEAACAGLGRELALAGRSIGDFGLCTALHYPRGGAIGWHADNLAFGPTVLSLSLGAPARLQLQHPSRDDAAASAVIEQELAPRSLFVLAGESRARWQHRVCPVRAERYSLTVRSAAMPGDFHTSA